MTRLLASELLRFRSRRLVVVLLAGALLATGVGLVIAAVRSTPPSAEVRAAAEAQAEQEFKFCMNSDFGDGVFPGTREEFCRENAGNPAHYMPSHLALLDLPQILEGVSSITSILGLVIGASFVAASWQSGTVTTIFTWEPRRLRWFAARILIVAAGVFVLTTLIVAFLSAGLALAAMLRGSTVGVDGPWWADTLATSLRVSVAAAISAVIGGAVAAIGRHTAAALGVVFVWTAVLEGLVRGLRPLWTPWLLGDNLVSFLSWRTNEYGFSGGSFVLSPGRALFVILGYTAVVLRSVSSSFAPATCSSGGPPPAVGWALPNDRRRAACSSWWSRRTVRTREPSRDEGRRGRSTSSRSVPCDAGGVLVGGAILNEAGDMIGSMLLLDLPDRRDLDAWLAQDPYVTDGVWQEIEVHPFRTAVGAWQPSPGLSASP